MNLILEQNEIILIILASLTLILLIWVSILNFRFKRLIKGSGKKTIEDSLVNIYKYIESANAENKKITNAVSVLQKQNKKSPRGLGFVSFKAFDGVRSGGANSFAVAFVSDEGNGIVLSTFHARDRVNVFSKEVKGFKAEVLLTEEEEKALTKAKQNLSL
jgi:hypothetical protein